MIKLDLIAGARPNFIKIAPMIAAIQKAKDRGNQIDYRLIHTGQHYDKKMSQTFFDELGIPEPTVNFGAGGGTQAEQTGKIMMAYEQLLSKESADLCLVVGDVTSTLACSIVAKKMHLKVAHVEAGIRSGDLKMPEEINRMVTDSITDYFFTTSEFANQNLLKNGVSKDRVFFVGNTMIDTLMKNMSSLKRPQVFDDVSLSFKNYTVITLHRPSNVDTLKMMEHLIGTIMENQKGVPAIFPVHPRTRKILDQINLDYPDLYLIDPLSYLEFNYLVKNSLLTITDSGGITEETTVMSVPCLTLRDSTERPETVSMGTNVLAGRDQEIIVDSIKKALRNDWKKGSIPPKWDGKTSERIVEILTQLDQN